MTRTAGAAVRAHLHEILVLAVLAGAIVWFLNVDATTTSVTEGRIQAPTDLGAGADRRYLDDMTVAIESAPVRQATAEATGLTVDQVISRLAVGPRIDGRVVPMTSRSSKERTMDLQQAMAAHAPIFITAPSARNGVTLIQRLLNSTRQIMVFGENTLLVDHLPNGALMASSPSCSPVESIYSPSIPKTTGPASKS